MNKEGETGFLTIKEAAEIAAMQRKRTIKFG